MKSFYTVAASAMLAMTVVTSIPAQAEEYPNKPITIIVPFGGGSGSDASARYFGEKMSRILGEAIIVENKPGAAGAIGMMAAKKAPADGYTLVQGGISPSVVNAVLVKDLGYDPVEDFVPLLGYGRNMNVLVAPIASNIKSMPDLKETADEPEKSLNVGTFSTTLQLAVSWMSDELGLKVTNIPYKGQAQALNDLMGEQIDLALVDLGGATPLLKEGKIRALAVTGENRSPEFPDVPTVKESGAPDYVLYSWNAFFTRSEVPEPIRAKLADAIKQVMTDPDTVNNFYGPKGTEGVAESAQAVQNMQTKEIERFKQVAQKLGIEQR